jgi:MFS family permease
MWCFHALPGVVCPNLGSVLDSCAPRSLGAACAGSGRRKATYGKQRPALPGAQGYSIVMTDGSSSQEIASKEASRARASLSRTVGQVSWQQTFAALKYPNYRLWFWGQMVSLFGTWMQSTAQGFLVFELTHSPAYLGYVGFAAGLPSWLFMLYAGVIADRMSRRTLMVITQTCMMVLAFIIAGLTFLGLIQPWHIIVLAFVLGVANAFDAPARQAFVLEMVEREDLTNAIALNSAMFNSALVVGPAAAGVIYAAFGPAWCFTVNGVSFIAVIVALLAMKLRPQVAARRRASTLTDLAEGLRFVASQPLVRTLVGLVGTTALFGMCFVPLIPAWAVTVLGGDATTNGLLQSARGVGALSGALLIASLGRFRFKGRLLVFGTFAFSIMLLVFAFVRWVPLSLFTLACVGTAQILFMNLANSSVQTLSPDALRGRVMGVYSLIFFGLMPIGSLLAGSFAQYFGSPLTVILGALISLVVATLTWAFVPDLRALE